MFGAFQKFGRMGAPAGAPWTERALYPAGASSPGLWIDGPSYPSSCYQDSAGTTALSTVGTVLDSSNPVGLVLDRKGGATSKTDPGIHLSQSTSAARPVASARVNLLKYSEDLSNAAWLARVDAAKISTTTFAPTVQYGCMGQVLAGKVPGQTYTFGVDVAAVSGNTTLWLLQEGATTSFTPITVTSTPQRFTCTGVIDAGGGLMFSVQDRNASGQGVVFVSRAQANVGSAALPYQRVNSDSDYTATGFPAYTKLDGVDDALSSATFSAGTLTSSMDCLIAVRRDSTANTVIGLYNAVADATKFFGMAESGSSSGCVGSGAGTPTVWVDGTQLTGGTAVTRGTLHTALTAGAWHIVEFRGLDLSTWTAVGHGLYTSYVRNGALGKIELFASGQDANRDKARARMAQYFGVTLP